MGVPVMVMQSPALTPEFKGARVCAEAGRRIVGNAEAGGGREN
jgi:hypothetical protein